MFVMNYFSENYAYENILLLTNSQIMVNLQTDFVPERRDS